MEDQAIKSVRDQRCRTEMIRQLSGIDGHPCKDSSLLLDSVVNTP